MGPSDLGRYLTQLSERLATVLGDDLLGVYAGGSIALGAYEPGRSDADVAAVCRDALSLDRKRRIVAELRHESLPCPARKLELVVYPLRTVAEPSADPGFELDLNTGFGVRLRAAFAPHDVDGGHWYVIDRAILARCGMTLTGPAASTLFADVPAELVLPALVESVRWYAAEDAPGDDAVLNACRALLYAAKGRWSAKDTAGQWALERVADRALIEDALRARRSGEPLDRVRVIRFLERVAEELERRPAVTRHDGDRAR